MDVRLCFLVALILPFTNGHTLTPTLLWASETVFGANEETSVHYQTVSFVDLWNSILATFVRKEPNTFFSSLNSQPDVFVLFASHELGLWQLSGDTSGSQPLKTAFAQSASKFVYNNAQLKAGKVMDFVPESFSAAGVDVLYLGGCAALDQTDIESGVRSVLSSKGADKPKVVVVCGVGGLAEQMNQVGQIDEILKDAKVGYVMMYVSEVENIEPEEYMNIQRGGRTLKQEIDAPKLTIRYDFCDELCKTRVKFLEGIILSLILAMALTAGLCCMHILDSPSQFEKPDEADS